MGWTRACPSWMGAMSWQTGQQTLVAWWVGQRPNGRGGKGHPWRHCQQRGWWRRHHKRLGRTVMEIAQALTPTLACVAGITGKGHNVEADIVLIAILVIRGVKIILTSLNFLVLVLP
jgi:hypothetical protein